MSELLNEEVEAAIDEMVEESIVETYYRMGHMISEISAGLARKVADKRFEQMKSIKDTMSNPEVIKRAKGRDGKMGGATAHKDRFDIDDQGARARKGLSGKKDADLAKDDDERPGYEKRHKPSGGKKTKSNPSGETLWTKSEKKWGRAEARAERKEQAEKDSKRTGRTAGEEDVREIKRRKRD